MKKNIQFVIVIFFVTLAFLIMLDDITHSEQNEYQSSTEVHDISSTSEVVTTDVKDEE